MLSQGLSPLTDLSLRIKHTRSLRLRCPDAHQYVRAVEPVAGIREAGCGFHNETSPRDAFSNLLAPILVDALQKQFTLERISALRHLTLRTISLLCCLAAIGGCAPISREACVQESAYDIGYAAALDNANRDGRFERVSKICIKQDRVVDQAQYLEGFAAGTAAFCQPGNGFGWGRRGRAYNGICQDAEFDMAYDAGLRAYKVEKRMEEIRSRLEYIRGRLSSITDILRNEPLTDERRRALIAEEDRFIIERSDLLTEQQSLKP